MSPIEVFMYFYCQVEEEEAEQQQGTLSVTQRHHLSESENLDKENGGSTLSPKPVALSPISHAKSMPLLDPDSAPLTASTTNINSKCVQCIEYIQSFP